MELQRDSFACHVQDDDFQLVVIDNSRTEGGAGAIKWEAKRLGLEYQRPPKPDKEFDTWMSNAWGLNYAFRWHAKHDDLAILLHPDIFLLRPVNLAQMMGKNKLAGIFLNITRKLQHDKHPGVIKKVDDGDPYPWPGLLFMANPLPDDREVCFGLVKNGDTGSYLAAYLLRHPELPCGHFSGMPLHSSMLFRAACNYGYKLGYDVYGNQFGKVAYSGLIENAFLHLSGASSNWSETMTQEAMRFCARFVRALR